MQKAMLSHRVNKSFSFEHCLQTTMTSTDESSEVEGYDLTEEENEGLCRAFALLDVDGDGVIDTQAMQELFVSLGRMPMDKEIAAVMSEGSCDGTPEMDINAFRQFVSDQLSNARDEDKLRKAFQVFDSTPPTGKLNVTQLRHYLKHKGLKLTDDEIDFLFREEDYWMLEEKNTIEYEELINKILDKPTRRSQFLNC